MGLQTKLMHFEKSAEKPGFFVYQQPRLSQTPEANISAAPETTELTPEMLAHHEERSERVQALQSQGFEDPDLEWESEINTPQISSREDFEEIQNKIQDIHENNKRGIFNLFTSGDKLLQEKREDIREFTQSHPAFKEQAELFGSMSEEELKEYVENMSDEDRINTFMPKIGGGQRMVMLYGIRYLENLSIYDIFGEHDTPDELTFEGQLYRMNDDGEFQNVLRRKLTISTGNTIDFRKNNADLITKDDTLNFELVAQAEQKASELKKDPQALLEYFQQHKTDDIHAQETEFSYVVDTIFPVDPVDSKDPQIRSEAAALLNSMREISPTLFSDIFTKREGNTITPLFYGNRFLASMLDATFILPVAEQNIQYVNVKSLKGDILAYLSRDENGDISFINAETNEPISIGYDARIDRVSDVNLLGKAEGVFKKVTSDLGFLDWVTRIEIIDPNELTQEQRLLIENKQDDQTLIQANEIDVNTEISSKLTKRTDLNFARLTQEQTEITFENRTILETVTTLGTNTINRATGAILNAVRPSVRKQFEEELQKKILQQKQEQKRIKIENTSVTETQTKQEAEEQETFTQEETAETIIPLKPEDQQDISNKVSSSLNVPRENIQGMNLDGTYKIQLENSPATINYDTEDDVIEIETGAEDNVLTFPNDEQSSTAIQLIAELAYYGNSDILDAKKANSPDVQNLTSQFANKMNDLFPSEGAQYFDSEHANEIANTLFHMGGKSFFEIITNLQIVDEDTGSTEELVNNNENTSALNRMDLKPNAFSQNRYAIQNFLYNIGERSIKTNDLLKSQEFHAGKIVINKQGEIV